MPDEILPADIAIENGRISEIGNNLAGEAIFDANGMYVCPGFVDIHAHGGGGADFLDGIDAFDTALRFHATWGVTSMLPTSITAPIEIITDFISNIRTQKKSDPAAHRRARIIGAHIEGPYLSQKNKGAQPESWLRIPARDPYDFLLDGADVIRTVTLSPELEGAVEMVRRLTKAGIIVCAGHDNGRKSTIIPSIEAGVSHLTHLWCAMSTVAMYDGVREPGLCEIGLVDDRLTAEIIADNHHMPPELVQIAYRCKGAKKLCVVSDCLRAGGMPCDGHIWALGPKRARLTDFIVSDGVARLPDNTRLAGSIQTVGQMVGNLARYCNIPLTDAVRMASLTPAEIIGAERDIGSLTVGKRADICILDNELKPCAVFIDGININIERE